MAKSSNLSYPAPFRYRRPGEDLQAVFGAQTGNPRVVTGESEKPAKPAKPAKSSTAKKKSPSAAAGKSSKAAKAKPAKVAASKKAKAKKPAGKR